MTTISAFLDMYGQFLNELAQTFPDDPVVKNVQAEPKTKDVFDDFMKAVLPVQAKIMAKDDSFFDPSNNFVSKLNLHVIWQSPDATDNTKNAIWQYLQTMYILGNTINMFPPETLTMIESAAEACAKNMQAQGVGPNSMSEKDLMAGMNNMLSQMFSGGLPGLPSGRAPPVPKRKVPKKK
jgi:hypothetical protein